MAYQKFALNFILIDKTDLKDNYKLIHKNESCGAFDST